VTGDEYEAGETDRRSKLAAIATVARYRPLFTLGIICLSVLTAALEGIGLSFLIPIIEIAQGSGGGGGLDGAAEVFVSAYEFLGVPFSLETVILGISLAMTARFTSSFLVTWLRDILLVSYIRHLQTQGFERALNARIAYYDAHGSDEILNAIVTQAEYAGRIIPRIVKLVKQLALSLVYFGVAVTISPLLTVVSTVVLGGLVALIRFVLESGYAVGDRVAEANERVQRSVQAGTQGIHEVKLFGVVDELFEDFTEAVDQFETSRIRLSRNEAVMDNTYQLLAALVVFALIYVALTVIDLSLASLGVFLFAMFRLAPRASRINDIAYKIEGDLPHLIRTRAFLDELEDKREPDHGTREPPTPVETISFEDVVFSYGAEEVLSGFSFSVDRGEFVAFVGPSGAGKSTVVSLLTRMYTADDGRITAEGTPIEEFELPAWRETIAVVRQNPHVFNDTLRYNLTIGNRTATDAEVQQACEIAQVTEFLDQLPEGLDTVLGDDGVRLSGGQRQRVAIARALLKPADILVLDEATSDLDSTLEQRVHDGIEEHNELIMIVIAHRLSTVTDADRIYTVEDGTVAESGSHDELLQHGGVYANLYDLDS
jgi:subfamily B ATP-binding cassette protein MsbA